MLLIGRNILKIKIHLKKIFIMKKCLLVIALLFSLQGFAQHSCCSKSSSATFASLSNDPSFVSSHLAPELLDFTPTVGKMVNIKCPDGKEAKVFEVKSGTSQGKVILMFHEWWGLNDYIKREAEKLHLETGFTVLALDLYDGNVATNPEEAAKFMNSVVEERARAIISAGIDYSGKFGKLQTIGWCYGGGWSIQAALMAGPQCVGCVIYYGMPETDNDKLSKLNAPVLGIFANKDQWINKEVVSKFDEQMKGLGKSLIVYKYDTDHAFANPSNPKYDKVSAEDAHIKALAFLKKNFEIPKPAITK